MEPQCTNIMQAVQKRLQEYKNAQEQAFLQLQTDIFNIIKASDNSASIPAAADFIERLTANEVMAFRAVCNELSNEGIGNVSIVKLQQKTNLSRPVYTNLFNKMKDAGVANIENQGVKGTHIILYSLDLMQIIREG